MLNMLKRVYIKNNSVIIYAFPNLYARPIGTQMEMLRTMLTDSLSLHLLSLLMFPQRK